MSLNSIEDSIEKLSKNSQKEFAQILTELEIEEETLESWIEIFSELKPKINENNQRYFTNRQTNIIKKIKAFVIDEEGDVNDLLKINIQEKTEKNLINNSQIKKHYFEQNANNKNEEIDKDEFVIIEDSDSLNNDLTSGNQINLNAKLHDFSKIKLYNIHPKINEQIQHNLKCAKLNLEELNNLLKNL